jgi:hypothetical protein
LPLVANYLGRDSSNRLFSEASVIVDKPKDRRHARIRIFLGVILRLNFETLRRQKGVDQCRISFVS